MPRERIITGIDIGSSKICTIISQLTNDDKISVIGVSSVPSHGIKRGVVVNIDEAVESIAESLEAAERMAGYAVNSAFITVDGNHISSLNSKGVAAVTNQGAEISEGDIERATEAAQAISIPNTQEIIHVIPRGYTVDSQEGVRDPAGMSGIRLEVETNIIYGATATMRNLARCVQQTGVDIESMVFGGIAAASSTLTDTETELGVALVDIGGGTTDIVIFYDGSPAYVSVLPIGGQHITNDLAVGLRTSLEDAEKIKIKISSGKISVLPRAEEGFRTELIKPLETPKDSEGAVEDTIDVSALGLEVSTIPKNLLDNIIDARLNEIFNLLHLEIKKSGMASKLPAGVVLVGGGAETFGAVAAAKKTLKIPVRLGQPSGVSGLVEEVSSPAFAASLGLLIYGQQFLSASRASSKFTFTKGKLGGILNKVTGLFESFLP